MKNSILLIASALTVSFFTNCATQETNVHQEKDGYVCFETDEFISQELCDKRMWKEMTADVNSESAELCQSASGNKYIQVLPDTRVTHEDTLLLNENFANVPGSMAVLSYDVEFSTPGRYYVWISLYSTGPEDNSLHIGLDGEWPESGVGMQWCKGKRSWRWESKKRTDEEHCGIPDAIYVDVKSAGVHEFMLGMREDGVKIDQIVLTLDKDYNPNNE